jgi:hypothetical protein
MSRSAQLAFGIVQRLRARRYAQVDGYKRFDFISEDERGITVSRERGADTRIAFVEIVKAVEAMRSDPAVYDRGPIALRKHIGRRIYSPLWAMLRLMTPRELLR